ncbi:MAG TPA: trypsin-like peptidase domain-containing protein [Ktedonobacterales bacterium]
MESQERHNSIAQPANNAPGAADTLPIAPLQPVYPPPAGASQPGAFSQVGMGVGNRPPSRRRYWKWYALGVLLLALMIGSFGVGHALTSRPSDSSGANSSSSSTVTLPAGVTDLQQTIIEVSEKAQASVVEVTSLGRSSEAIGSGVILTSDGYIATNDHVVRGYDTFSVALSDGTKLDARLIGQDAQDDLAVLKIAATDLPPIPFADSSQVQVGQFALAIGSPLGLENSTTFGIVSAVNRTESEAPDGPASALPGLIQTSAAINPGNSGGALVNLQGQLIGMPTLGASADQGDSAANDIGFAIPSNRIKFVTDQLTKSGELTSTGQGFLGIQGRDVTPQFAAAEGLSAQQGVLVTGFANDASGGSPAQQAGLQMGDVIIAVDGKYISDNNDLASALLSQQPGTQVTLTVARAAAQQTIKATLGERPVNAQG